MFDFSKDRKVLLKVDPDFKGELIIPEGIEVIRNSAALKHLGITGVVFPKSLKQIQDSAFLGCEEMRRVIIPDGVEEIGHNAFSLNSSFVSSIILPKTVRKICGDSFDVQIYVDERNPYLRDAVGPKGECMIMKKRTNELLYLYERIEENLEIPRGIEVIGDDVFKGKKYKCVKLPESVKEIKNSAFSCMRNLRNLILNEKLEYIGDYAFSKCYLSEIKLPSSLRYIGTNAFSDCYNIPNIVIPKGVEYIGPNAFSCNVQIVIANECFKMINSAICSHDMRHLIQYCGNDDTFRIPDGIETIESLAFYKNKNLRKIIFPSSLKVIGEKAFEGCVNIHTLYLNEGLEFINKDAFLLLTHLQTVKIPDTVKYIGEGAFDGCFDLKDFALFTKSIYDIHIAEDIFGIPNLELEVTVMNGMELLLRKHKAFEDVSLFKTYVS